MASDAGLVASVILKHCDGVFQGLNSIADVGGGTGTLAKSIAKAFPDINCISFDVPNVVKGLDGSKNLTYVGGDMFEAIPKANAVLLNWILHDWNDNECIRILKRCKDAIPSKENGGKRIILEMVLKNQPVGRLILLEVLELNENDGSVPINCCQFISQRFNIKMEKKKIKDRQLLPFGDVTRGDIQGCNTDVVAVAVVKVEEIEEQIGSQVRIRVRTNVIQYQMIILSSTVSETDKEGNASVTYILSPLEKAKLTPKVIKHDDLQVIEDVIQVPDEATREELVGD
ncbi:trans-resveratrol di-O-methyltransferase-like protein [Tanacetum coccineum]|uniref:Trans-resveratrol di-O-methyltransferase-like protein n=1 Tax=Tanacetum coccineum TaxID=301880 RepID=A0ABQ4WNP8_9ASTR